MEIAATNAPEKPNQYERMQEMQHKREREEEDMENKAKGREDRVSISEQAREQAVMSKSKAEV